MGESQACSQSNRNADLVQVDDSKQVNGHTNGTADGAGAGDGGHEDSDDDKDDESGHAEAGAPGGKFLNARLLHLRY